MFTVSSSCSGSSVSPASVRSIGEVPITSAVVAAITSPPVGGPPGVRVPCRSEVTAPTRDLALVVGEDHRLAADREVAPLRPADVDLGHQDPAQVGVAAKDDPEEVVDLALLEVGGREHLDAGVELRKRVAAPGPASAARTRIRSTRSRLSSS